MASTADSYYPNFEPPAIETPLEGRTATHELKNFRVSIEEQSEELKSEQGNGGYLVPIRVEDKRGGEVQRTVVMGWVLLVKDMGEDPPEIFTWSKYSAWAKPSAGPNSATEIANGGATTTRTTRIMG